jgi:hypothetical protein
MNQIKLINNNLKYKDRNIKGLKYKMVIYYNKFRSLIKFNKNIIIINQNKINNVYHLNGLHKHQINYHILNIK